MTKRLQPCTVKKIQRLRVRSADTEVLTQHTVRERDRTVRNVIRSSTGSAATVDLLCIRSAPALPISAVFGLRYRHDPMRTWGASGIEAARSPFWGKQSGGMVVWGDGDSAVRSGVPGGAWCSRVGRVPDARQLCFPGQVHQPR